MSVILMYILYLASDLKNSDGRPGRYVWTDWTYSRTHSVQIFDTKIIPGHFTIDIITLLAAHPSPEMWSGAVSLKASDDISCKMPEEFMVLIFPHRICVEIRLISPKLAQF